MERRNDLNKGWHEGIGMTFFFLNKANPSIIL